MDQEQFITVEIPGYGEVDFPASMPEEQIASESHRLFEDYHRNRKVPRTEDFTPKSFGGFVANAFEDAKRVGSALDPRNWPGMVTSAVEDKRRTEEGFEDEIRNPNRAYSAPGDRFAAGIQKIPGVIYERPVQTALEIAPAVKPVGAATSSAARAVVNAVKAHPNVTSGVVGAIGGGLVAGPGGALEGALGGSASSKILREVAKRFTKTPEVPKTPADQMGMASPEALAAREATAVIGSDRGVVESGRSVRGNPRPAAPVEPPSSAPAVVADVIAPSGVNPAMKAQRYQPRNSTRPASTPPSSEAPSMEWLQNEAPSVEQIPIGTTNMRGTGAGPLARPEGALAEVDALEAAIPDIPRRGAAATPREVPGVVTKEPTGPPPSKSKAARGGPSPNDMAVRDATFEKAIREGKSLAEAQAIADAEMLQQRAVRHSAKYVAGVASKVVRQAGR